MDKNGRMNRRMKKFLDELFSGQLSEQEICRKMNISECIYDKWLKNAHFVSEFDRRMQVLVKNCQLQIAQFAQNAVTKLIGLTDSQKDELAMKACLEVLKMLNLFDENDKSSQSSLKLAEERVLEGLDKKAVSEILNVLAVNQTE